MVGDTYRPALVSEVALQLAEDGGRGEGGELQTPAGFEPVDRLEQSDGGHLFQVVDRDAAVGKPAGQMDGQPEVGGDQLISERGVTRAREVIEPRPKVRPLAIVEGHVNRWAV
jgi:hypothetical protein